MGTSNNWGNDFVQAYLGGVRTRIEREKQKFDQQQQLDQAPLQKEYLKKQIEHIDQLNAEAQAQAGYHAEALKSAIRQQFMTGERVAPPALNNPQMPGQKDVQLSPVNFVDQQPQQASEVQGPSYQGPSAPSSFQSVNVDPRIGTGGVLNIDNVPTPDQQDARTLKDSIIAARTAGLKAGMEAEAKAPSEIKVGKAKADATTEGNLKVEGAKAQTAKELESIKAGQQTELEKQKTAAALAVANLHNSATITAAKIRADATKYATDNKSKIDPNDIADSAMLSATGSAPPPTGFSNNAIAQRGVMKRNNIISFDPKDAEKLKSVNDVNVLFQTMQDEVNKMPENKLSALGDRIAAKIPGTDAYNFRSAVFGKAANISHTYGGEIGRLSDPDVARAMGTLVEPGITKEEAMKRLDIMKQETSSKVLDHILGGMQPKQQLWNLTKYGFDPEKFVVKVKGQSIPKFIKDGETWRSLNLKTGTYDTVQ